MDNMAQRLRGSCQSTAVTLLEQDALLVCCTVMLSQRSGDYNPANLIVAGERARDMPTECTCAILQIRPHIPQRTLA